MRVVRWVHLALCVVVTAMAVQLENCARAIAKSFRAACINNPEHEPLGFVLDEFVRSSVDALTAGYDLRLLQFEVDLLDDDSDRGLTECERAHRRRWLRAIRHTLDLLSSHEQKLHDSEDVEIAALAGYVVHQQTLSMGIQLERAIEISGGLGATQNAPSPVAPTLIPVSQLVLLTMRRVWQIEAEDLYPGATG